MDHDQGPVGSGWLVALETSGLGDAMRQSVWLYPLVEVLHILGFALLVGSILAFDLRLLGVRAPLLPAEALARLLLPVAVTGFALAVPTGLLLFTTEATSLVRNGMFLAKMALLALALVNIVLFHKGAGRRMAAWGVADRPPPAARFAGAASLGLWVAVLVCGRLIAYV
ncbi:DUF6644 family protein [Azospirillum rugosum]|uniref:DUF6644 domain-containing protein n=1 Tax=Azospirillum rugosum TaxID=416170 RepID=A0ABS4SEE0_9PROT|nr:DUF6644 family protein [Azospirillum rugosum]MBP2290862.1 hypothetical protein [Azospirillum rugosum]MDQ0529729.1 hypothetical protein [Azospirillum rugosum]